MFQGSVLVKCRLQLEIYCCCVLLVSQCKLVSSLPPVLFKSTGHKEEEKVTEDLNPRGEVNIMFPLTLIVNSAWFTHSTKGISTSN